MNHIDYNDYVDIRITKVHFDGEPTHWEVDINDAENSLGGGTCPTFQDAMDIIHQTIYGGYKNNWEVNSWATFDANERNQ